MNFIITWLGKLMLLLYSFIPNYGVAIILFTILVKLLMLPLSIKQQKSMMETQRVQPLLAELQKKYKNDKEKLNQETVKLYQEHNINPMSGCLPLLIQLPIIWALYRVISQPLSSMYGVSKEVVVNLANALGLNAKSYTVQIDIAQKLTPALVDKFNLTFDKIDFSFLGLNLGVTPSLYSINWYWIIPILAMVTTWLSTKVSTAMTNQKPTGDPASDKTMQTMNQMNLFMPLLTGWITFTVPSGVGLYWLASNVVQIVQQYFLNLYFKKNKDPLVIEKDPKKDNNGKKGGAE